MRLVLVPHDGNLLDAYILPTAVSVTILVGATYGFIRGVIDASQVIARWLGIPPPRL